MGEMKIDIRLDAKLVKKIPYKLVLAGIFHLLWIVRCSTGLNGSDPEQMKDRG